MLDELGGMFAQFLGGARGSQQMPPAFREVQEWVTELAKHAFQKWGITMLSGMPCNCSPRCPRTAVGACVICRRPSCLGHAFTSADGFVACHGCVRAASIQKGNAAPPRVNERENEEISEEELRKKHLRTLKLKLGATEDEIRATFKRFVAENHPDKSPEKKREAATKKFVEVKTAYEWLIANGQKKAA